MWIIFKYVWEVYNIHHCVNWRVESCIKQIDNRLVQYQKRGVLSLLLLWKPRVPKIMFRIKIFSKKEKCREKGNYCLQRVMQIFWEFWWKFIFLSCVQGAHNMTRSKFLANNVIFQDLWVEILANSEQISLEHVPVNFFFKKWVMFSLQQSRYLRRGKNFSGNKK